MWAFVGDNKPVEGEKEENGEKEEEEEGEIEDEEEAARNRGRVCLFAMEIAIVRNYTELFRSAV